MVEGAKCMMCDMHLSDSRASRCPFIPLPIVALPSLVQLHDRGQRNVSADSFWRDGDWQCEPSVA